MFFEEFWESEVEEFSDSDLVSGGFFNFFEFLEIFVENSKTVVVLFWGFVSLFELGIEC